MARARNIKPGLYKNEDLAECSIWARYIFPGMWMLADREGRMEDRPKRIKGELLAYDSVDVDPLLVELEKFGFILRYEAQGQRFIQILKFSEHQAPHVREQASSIPAPYGCGQSINEEVVKHSLGSAMSSPRSPDSLIPSSLNPSTLIPDTGYLNPSANDTAIPTSPAKNEKAGAVVILPHVALSIAFRNAGIKAQPANPKLMTLAEQGVTPETVAAACADALAARPDAGFGYVLAIIERWSKEAKDIRAHGAAPPAARASPGYQTPNEKAKAWADKLTGNKHHEQRTPNFIDINTIEAAEPVT